MTDFGNAKITVMDSQGKEAGQASAQELTLIGQAHQALTHHQEFTTQYPGAILSRVEVQRDLQDHEQGKVYLRYDVPGKAAQEFWAKAGKAQKINLRTGRITVHIDPAS